MDVEQGQEAVSHAERMQDAANARVDHDMSHYGQGSYAGSLNQVQRDSIDRDTANRQMDDAQQNLTHALNEQKQNAIANNGIKNTSGYVVTQHPPFAGEGWSNRSGYAGDSDSHGGRGNGENNAANSNSAHGLGGGDHIGGGRSGGGYHY